MKCIKINGKTWTMDAYLLAPSLDGIEKTVRPAVLVIPGGAYRFCSQREGEPVAASFLSEGLHAFVLHYSVGEQSSFQQCLQDAKEAFAYIRSHGEDWGVAPDKIAVCGFSAGGHLAAALSCMTEEPPAASILGYPCILKATESLFPFPVPSVQESVSEKTPPAFLFASASDSCVPIENTLAYAGALAEHHIPFSVHIFHDGPHGFSMAKPHTAGTAEEQYSHILAQWFPLCMDFLYDIFDIHVGNRRKF